MTDVKVGDWVLFSDFKMVIGEITDGRAKLFARGPLGEYYYGWAKLAELASG